MGATSTGGPSSPVWQPATDRRGAPRQNVVDSHLVTVDLAFQSGALLLDLSEAGMGVQALSSAPPGDTTSLHFELPETGGRVDALGRIAWTDSSGRLGIRFEEISELSRAHLAQWLSRERRPISALGGNITMPAWPPAHMRDEIAALRRDLVTQKLEGDPALALVVERTRSVIRATGAAVALEDTGAVVCRASSGNAPAVGAHLDPSSGLSGECIRTGEIVRCEDTETDPRADRLVCRKLELRSIIIVPIRIHGRTAGVLEAFSSRAHAFQSSDVLLLRRIADLVAGIAVRQLDASHSAPAGPHAVMAATVLEPLQETEPDAGGPSPLMMDEIFELGELAEPEPPPAEHAAQAPPQPPKQPEPAALDREPEHKPVVPSVASGGSAAAAQPAKVSEPTAAPADTKSNAADTAQPRVHASYPAAVDTGTPVAARAPWIPRPVPADQEESDSARRLEPMLAEIEAERPSQWRMRFTGGAILAVALIVAGWQVWKLVSPPKGTPMDAEVKNAQIAPAPPPATPATPAPEPAATAGPAPEAPKPSPPASSKAAAKPATPRVVPVSATPAPPRIPESQPAAALADEVTTRRLGETAGAPASAAPAANAQIASSAPAKAEEIPPSIGFVSRPVKSSPISMVLSAPVAAPSLPALPVSRITGGKLVHRVNPVYPSSAMGIYGEVLLKATVGKDGKVKSVKVVKGHAALAQAAVSAIRRWRYQPFILNGVPIEVENNIQVDFKAPAR